MNNMSNIIFRENIVHQTHGGCGGEKSVALRVLGLDGLEAGLAGGEAGGVDGGHGAAVGDGGRAVAEGGQGRGAVVGVAGAVGAGGGHVGGDVPEVVLLCSLLRDQLVEGLNPLLLLLEVGDLDALVEHGRADVSHAGAVVWATLAPTPGPCAAWSPLGLSSISILSSIPRSLLLLVLL